jgi:hypothetical protein
MLVKPKARLHQFFFSVSDIFLRVQLSVNHIRDKSGIMLHSPPFFASWGRLEKMWGPRKFGHSSLFLFCTKQEK